jgi:hypothetical protein
VTYSFFEKGTREGIRQCSNKYSKSYENTQLIFLLANLYGWILSQKRSQKNFKWVHVNSEDLPEILYDQNSNTAYVY